MSSKPKAGAATAPAGILGELCRACLGLAFTAEEAEELRVGVEHHHAAAAGEHVTIRGQAAPEAVELGILLKCLGIGFRGPRIALTSQQLGLAVGVRDDLDALTAQDLLSLSPRLRTRLNERYRFEHPEDTRIRIARHAGEVLACHGDVLQFRSPAKRKRKVGSESKSTAEVFNTLARGLAAAQTLGHDIDFVLRELRKGARAPI